MVRVNCRSVCGDERGGGRERAIAERREDKVRVCWLPFALYLSHSISTEGGYHVMAVENSRQVGRWTNVRSWISLAASVIAVGVTGIVAYWGTLKPFSLGVWVDPVVQIQHQKNLGVQINLSFRNESPRSGLVSGLAMVMNKSENPEDKYLLTCIGFKTYERVDSATAVYRPTGEQLPVLIGSRQWASRTAGFVYTASEQFPISMGTYDCQVLVWTDYEERARFSESMKFEITAEILDTYEDRRDRGSTWLEPIPTVGTVPLESEKLSTAEYEALIP